MQRSPLATSDDDLFVVVMVGLAAAGTALGSAAVFWTSVTTWLVRHHLLAPAGDAVVVSLPAADGAGLDLARLVVLAAVVLAVTACIASLIYHWLAARRAAE